MRRSTRAPSAAMHSPSAPFQARLPSLLPESYGISVAAFTDFGTWAGWTMSSGPAAPPLASRTIWPSAPRPALSVRLEIALRPAADRSGPALSSRPVTIDPRSSTSPPEQDSKTMKKTLLAIMFVTAAAVPALAANPPPPPHAAENSPDRPRVDLASSKVGQDVARQIETFGNQAKAEICRPAESAAGRGPAAPAAGRHSRRRCQGQESSGFRGQAGRPAGGCAEEGTGDPGRLPGGATDDCQDPGADSA